jgi:hypothetical protein
MKTLLAFFTGLLISTATFAADAQFVTDLAHLLPPDAAKALDEECAAFESVSGVRVLVEFRAESPRPEEDKVPGVFMRELATKRGTVERGVLMVYFADDPDWRLWIGDRLTEKFSGRKGSVAELTENKSIHDVKEAIFAAAKARADAAEKDPKSARHLAVKADALLEELFRRLR